MKQCDICGKEAKARSIELLKPQSEWDDKDCKEYQFTDICYSCSTHVLWGIRNEAIMFAEHSKKGLSNEEIKALLDNVDCGCDNE